MLRRFRTLLNRFGITQRVAVPGDGDPGPPPYGLAFRSSEGFIVFTVSLAVFSDIFLYGVIVPVIPFALVQRSGVSQDDVQFWVSILVAAYGASLFAFSPLCGWLADRTLSRRSPLLLGLLTMAGATVMLNVCNSLSLLIVGRILQGASAAVVWIVGLALLADTAEQSGVGKSMGYVALGMSLGLLTSPLLGGIVFDYGGYNAVFAMSYGLLGVDIVLRLAIIEKKVAKKWTETSAVVADEEAGAKAPSHSDGDGTTEKATIIEDPRSPADTAADLPANETNTASRPTQRRYRLPPLLSLLFSRRLLIALFASVVQATLLTTFDSVLTLHVQRVFNWTATGAGLLFLALVVPTFLSPLVGILSDRYGARYPVTLGFFLTAPLFVCLRFVTYNSLQQKVLMCALLALIGLALSLTLPPLMAEVTYVVEAKHRKYPGVWGGKSVYAQAYGLYNMAFALGCVLGPIWGGLVNERAGWGTMSWSLGLLSGITAVPCWIWVGGSVFAKRENEQ